MDVEAAGFPDSNPALVVSGLLALRYEGLDHVAGSEAMDHFLAGPVASGESVCVGKGSGIETPTGASDTEYIKVRIELDTVDPPGTGGVKPMLFRDAERMAVEFRQSTGWRLDRKPCHCLE